MVCLEVYGKQNITAMCWSDCLCLVGGIAAAFSIPALVWYNCTQQNWDKINTQCHIIYVKMYWLFFQLSDLHRHKQDTSAGTSDLAAFEPLFKCPFKTHLAPDRVRLQTRISLSSGIGMISSKGAPVSPRVQHEARFFQRETFLDLPRRLRLLYFWASTRVVQRFIMVGIACNVATEVWMIATKHCKCCLKMLRFTLYVFWDCPEEILGCI